MNKDFLNMLVTNYYVEWKTSEWMTEIFKQNGFNDDEIDWDSLFGGSPKTETPGRAPSLYNIQTGK